MLFSRQGEVSEKSKSSEESRKPKGIAPFLDSMKPSEQVSVTLIHTVHFPKIKNFNSSF